MKFLRKLGLWLNLSFMVAISLIFPISASAANGVAQGYKVGPNVVVGMSVALLNDTVYPSSPQNQNNLLGVVVSSNSVAVTLASEALARSVRLRISAAALRSVEHRGGLDDLLHPGLRRPASAFPRWQGWRVRDGRPATEAPDGGGVSPERRVRTRVAGSAKLGEA